MSHFRMMGRLLAFLLMLVCALPVQAAAAPRPRLAHGHPQALWDAQDVAAYKASFATDEPLKAAFEALRAWGDARVAMPIGVPVHRVEADGTWSFPDFKRGYPDAAGIWHWEWNFNTALQKRAADVSDLGMLYALSGDARYATEARAILLTLANAYGAGQGGFDRYDHNHFEAYGFDGGDAGMVLAKICHGYDLIYRALSAEDRARIERALIRPLAEHLEASSFMYTSHGRWGMVCLYGVFIAGETLGDRAMTDLALYGPGGSADQVTGGFMHCFQSGCLRAGTVWGADTKLEDQLAAASVLTAVAEVMRHHGVDLYGYQGGAMKTSYDAALKVVAHMDDAQLRALPGIDAFAYAFRRYRDPLYRAVADRLEPGFTLAIGEHLPSPPGLE